MTAENPFPLPLLPDPFKLLRDIASRSIGAGLAGVVKPVAETIVNDSINVIETGARAMIEQAPQNLPEGIGDYYSRNQGEILPRETTATATHHITQQEADDLVDLMSRFVFTPDPGKDHMQSPEELEQNGFGDCEDLMLYASRMYLIPHNIHHQRAYGYLYNPEHPGGWEGHAFIVLGPNLVYDYNFVDTMDGRYRVSGYF